MAEPLRAMRVSLSMDTTEYVNGAQQAKTVTRSFRQDVNLTQAEMAALTEQYRQQGVVLKFQIDESKKFSNQLKSQISDFRNSSNELSKISAHYLKLTGAIGLTGDQLEEYNALQMLGADASAELKQQVKDMVATYQRLRAEQAQITQQELEQQAQTKKTTDAISQLEAQLKQQNDTLGLSAKQLAEYNALQSLGTNASDEQIAKVKELVAAQNALREQFEATDSINQLEQLYKKQAETLGMNAEQLEEYNAVQRLGANATEEQIAQVRSMVTAQQQLRASQLATQQAENQQKQELQQTTRAIEQLELELRQLNETRDMDARAIAQYNAVQRLGANATQQQIEQTQRLAGELHDLRQSQNVASGGFSNLRGVAASAGYQLQDVVVQAQMGTDAFVILAQQGSQFAGAFGATGAIIGAVIAIVAAGMPVLIKLFNEGIVSAKELEEAQKNLNEVFEKVDGTVVEYTDSIKKLYTENKALGELSLSVSLNKAEESLRAYKDQLEEALGKSIVFADRELTTISAHAGNMQKIAYNSSTTFDDLAKGAERRLQEYAKELGIHKEQLLDLTNTYKTFKETGNLEPLVKSIDSLRDSSGKLDPQLNTLASSIITLYGDISKTSTQIKELKKTLSGGDGLGNSTDELVKKWDEKTKALYRSKAAQEAIQEAVENDIEIGSAEYKQLQQRINSYYAQADAIENYKSTLSSLKNFKDSQNPKDTALKEHQERIKDLKAYYGTQAANQSEFERWSAVSWRQYQKELADLSKQGVKEQKKSVEDLISAWKLKTQALGENNEASKAQLEIQKAKITASKEQTAALSAEIQKYEEKKEALSLLKSVRTRIGGYDLETGDKFEQAYDKYQKDINDLNKLKEGAEGVKMPQSEYEELSTKAYEKYYDDVEKIINKRGKDQTKSFQSNFKELIQGFKDIDAEATAEAAQAVLNQAEIMNQAYTMISGTVSLLSMTKEEMEAQTEGMNSAQKAMFLLTQAFAAASAIVQGMKLGADMAANFSGGNPATAATLMAMGTAMGTAQAGAIMGTAIVGVFDKGGYIPSGKAGIVSEYGAELVNGALVMGAASVTSREETAKLLSSNSDNSTSNNVNTTTVVQNISISGAGDKYLASALQKAAEDGAKKGAVAGYNMVKSDMQNGRGIRQILKKSIGG